MNVLTFFLLLLLCTARLWTCGWNEQGQLGRVTAEASSSLLAPVDGLAELVVAVAGGWAHTLAVDAHGRLWAWGSNRHGQIGKVREKPLESYRHAKLFTGRRPAVVPAGVTSVETSSSTPTRVSIRDECGSEVRVIAVAAGMTFSAAVDAAGRLYTWGAGRHGELGSVSGAVAASEPTLVPWSLSCPVHAVAAGQRHLFAMDRQGYGKWCLFDATPALKAHVPGTCRHRTWIPR